MDLIILSRAVVERTFLALNGNAEVRLVHRRKVCLQFACPRIQLTVDISMLKLVVDMNLKTLLIFEEVERLLVVIIYLVR